MKNKNTKNSWMWSLAILVAFVCLLPSCKQHDEVVPLQESSINRTYKMPDPIALTVDEQSEVDKIRDEYKNNTK